MHGSFTDLKPQPGMPMAWRTKSTSWTKKMKKKTKKLNELSLLQGKRKRVGGSGVREEQQVRASEVLRPARPALPCPPLTGKPYTWGGTSTQRSRV